MLGMPGSAARQISMQVFGVGRGAPAPLTRLEPDVTPPVMMGPGGVGGLVGGRVFVAVAVSVTVAVAVAVAVSVAVPVSVAVAVTVAVAVGVGGMDVWPLKKNVSPKNAPVKSSRKPSRSMSARAGVAKRPTSDRPN